MPRRHLKSELITELLEKDGQLPKVAADDRGDQRGDQHSTGLLIASQRKSEEQKRDRKALSALGSSLAAEVHAHVATDIHSHEAEGPARKRCVSSHFSAMPGPKPKGSFFTAFLGCRSLPSSKLRFFSDPPEKATISLASA